MVAATRITPARLRLLWILFFAASAAVVGISWSWLDKARENRTLAGGIVLERYPFAPETPADRPAPHLRFAQAVALAANGDFDAALARYRSLYDHPTLQVAARYNSGNLLIREAARMRVSDRPQDAVALVELAKEAFRGVLRTDPEHWAARYNYERAQRLQPDVEAEGAAIGGPRNEAERSISTRRGIAAGLP